MSENTGTGIPFIDNLLTGYAARFLAFVEKATPTEMAELMNSGESFVREVNVAISAAKALFPEAALTLRLEEREALIKEAGALFALAKQAQGMGYGVIAQAYLVRASAMFGITVVTDGPPPADNVRNLKGETPH